MTAEAKKAITALLKLDEANSNYENNYWFSYEDFFDPEDDFMCFSCESLEGKQKYITLIENLLDTDKTAKIFVEVYGLEEDNEPFIYADTLIIFSKLSLLEIQKIFKKPKDIFPDYIEKMTDFPNKSFIVRESGELIPAKSLLSKDYIVYVCWWD